MSRLRRFVEAKPFGEATDRIAYVLNAEMLPEPFSGRNWKEDEQFNVAAALLAEPSLKTVIKEAVDKGVAVVSST